jgi:hypothetical protein
MSFGGGSSAPPVVTPPAAPQKTDAEIQAAAEAQRERIRKMLGRSKTILTGGEGVLGGTSSVTNQKTLLG